MKPFITHTGLVLPLDGVHANWPDRFFGKIVDAFLTATGNQGGRVGNAMSYILRARGLLDFASPLMEAVAKNPRAADHLCKRDPHP
jgi:hypothetical protein